MFRNGKRNQAPREFAKCRPLNVVHVNEIKDRLDNLCILTHETLFRLGFAVYLIELACQITMTVLMYDLLKPVSRSIVLLSAIFGLIECTSKILSRLFFYAPFLVLGGAHYLSVFNADQKNARASYETALKVNPGF